MKIIILAGGLGTRMSEYTKSIPKPMVKIAGQPMLLHIMRHYLKFGFKSFYIAGGYKSEVIKSYFKNYKKSGVPFLLNLSNKKCEVVIADTGIKTLTGGRLKKMKKFINKDENFMFTYGDGISDVNINKLLNFHIKNKKIVTVTAVRPPARFGEINLKGNIVHSFKEKPQVTSGWINGGFFVAKYSFFKFIFGDKSILEKKPLEKVCKKKQLVAYKHFGFWKCMDTKRDKEVLEDILKKRNNL